MPPASLERRTNKNSVCSLTLLHSCVFFDAGRVLSIFIHLFGEEEGRGEMGEGIGRGREWGVKGKI